VKSIDQLGQSEKERYTWRADELRRMRIIATGLLLFMAVLFVIGNYMESRYQGHWGFLRAFAEAGMVGGLADWFAVTALFRHPLGIPIPHTAIIPNNKERLGRAAFSEWMSLARWASSSRPRQAAKGGCAWVRRG
jgi:hypothetical protein